MPTKLRIRRATIDDREALVTLWKKNQLPAETLEPQFTEFQIAEDENGKLLGAIGLWVVENQGLLHSEAFDDFGVADQARPLLWERMQSVGRNYGLFRFWTTESAPFWVQQHFGTPTADQLAKLPPQFPATKHPWLLLKLKDEASPAVMSMEQHLALFKQAQQQESEKRFQQAKVMKFIAMVLAVLLFVIVFGGVFYLMKNKSRLPQRQQEVE